MPNWKSSALVLALLLWAGVLFGVAFLATPAKFSAPSLSLPVALEVGRATFAILSRAEIAFAALSLGLVLAGAAGRTSVVTLCVIAWLGLLLNVLWLLPLLDERAQVVIDGGTPPPSHLHGLYIVIDAAKFLVLLAAAVLLLVQQRSR